MAKRDLLLMLNMIPKLRKRKNFKSMEFYSTKFRSLRKTEEEVLVLEFVFEGYWCMK